MWIYRFISGSHREIPAEEILASPLPDFPPITAAVLCMAGDEAPFLNGAVIVPEGGVSCN